MSTRSTVAMKTEDGLVGMYVHWDGYPTGNGQILKDSYDNDAKVAELIALGDLSKLGSEIGQVHYDTSIKRAEGTAELADCEFYMRDKGESDVGAQTFDDVAEFVEYYKDSNCEFFYLLTRNGWIVSDGTMSNGTPVFTMLETELLEKV